MKKQKTFAKTKGAQPYPFEFQELWDLPYQTLNPLFSVPYSLSLPFQKLSFLYPQAWKRT